MHRSLPSWIRRLQTSSTPRPTRRRCRPHLEALEVRLVPSSTYIVNSTGDTGTGSGLTGDLRYCITQANSAGGPNFIDFDQTVFNTPQTITLTSALPIITDDNLAIFGPGNGLVTISGNNLFPVFQIFAPATLDGLIITQGKAANGAGIDFWGLGTLNLGDCTVSGNTAGQGGGLYNGLGQALVTNSTLTGNSGYLNGGGIDNFGTLTLTNSVVSGNSAIGGGGGGLSNSGTAILIDSTVSTNHTMFLYGGGIDNLAGTLTLTNSVVSGNSANGGGGIANFGGLALNHSSLSGNSATNARGGGLLNKPGSNANLYGYSFVTGNSAGYAGYGGGIFNYGTLTLTNDTVSGNYGMRGAGMFNESSATLTNTTLSGNTARAVGGGIENWDTLTLTNGTVSGNYARAGGGIDTSSLLGGTSTLTSVVVSGNRTQGAGGGILNGGPLTLTNSTVSGNTGSLGAGISNYFALTLTNSTISGNNNPYGGVGGGSAGGIGCYGTKVTPISMNNTLVAGNTSTGATPDVNGTVTSTSGFNLIGNGTGVTGISNGVNGNQIGTAASPINPLLSALGNYGGPTQTMGLLPGSPALDAGSNALAVDSHGNPLTTDQRGFARIVNGIVDIGAFESSSFIIDFSGGNFQVVQVGQGFPNALMVLVSSAFNEPVGGGLVTFTAPATGASARLAPTQATISSDGLASTLATANTVAGSYIVTASVNPHTTPLNFSLSNLPGPATQFQIVSTHSAKVNTPFSFKVRARDVYGNLATGYTGTVAFNSSDPLAVLPGPYSFTSSDQGAHSFMATLNTVGSQTLTATDTSNSSITEQAVITVRSKTAPQSGSMTLSATGTGLEVGLLDDYFVQENQEPAGVYVGGR
jgi:hypothetical protein